MNMMNMYNNMNNTNNMNQNQQQQQPNFSMQKQEELLDAWKQRQAAQEKAKEKYQMEMEAHEREENMKAQWKQWEQKLQMAQNFDTIGYERWR